jgi:hypothetical protein
MPTNFVGKLQLTPSCAIQGSCSTNLSVVHEHRVCCISTNIRQQIQIPDLAMAVLNSLILLLTTSLSTEE